MAFTPKTDKIVKSSVCATAIGALRIDEYSKREKAGSYWRVFDERDNSHIATFYSERYLNKFAGRS